MSSSVQFNIDSIARVKLTGSLNTTGDVTVAGHAALSSTLAVSGTSTLSGAATLSSTLAVNGTSTLSGAATLGNTVTVAGHAALSSTLAVTGTSSHTGASTFGNTIAVTGAATLSSTLAVTGDVSFNNNLYVKKQMVVDGSMNINDKLFMNNSVTETLNYKYVDIPSPLGSTATGGWSTTSGITINWNATGGTTLGNNNFYGYYTAFNSVVNNSGWLGANSTYNQATGNYSAGLTTTITNGIGAISGDYLEIQSNTAYKLTQYQFMTYGEASGPSLNDKLPKNYYIVGSNNGTTWDPIQKVNDLYLSANNGVKQLTNLYTISTNTSEITQGTPSNIGYRKVTGYSTTTNDYTRYRVVIENIHGTSAAGRSGTDYNIAAAGIGQWVINGQYKDTNQTSTVSTTSSVQFNIDSIARVKLTGSLNTTGDVTVASTDLLLYIIL